MISFISLSFFSLKTFPTEYPFFHITNGIVFAALFLCLNLFAFLFTSRVSVLKTFFLFCCSWFLRIYVNLDPSSIFFLISCCGEIDSADSISSLIFNCIGEIVGSIASFSGSCLTGTSDSAYSSSSSHPKSVKSSN